MLTRSESSLRNFVQRRRPTSTPAHDGLGDLARWMDSVFTIPGTNIRFGLDSLLGLLPGAGDTATSLVALYILATAHRQGVSRATLARMGANVAIDFIVGSIPLVGDLFDVYFKSNQRNVRLMERHLAATSEESRRLQRGDRWFVVAILALLAVLLVASLLATYWLAAILLKAIFGA